MIIIYYYVITNSLPANDVSALLLKFMDDFKIPFNFEPNTDCHAKSTEIDLKKSK
jgi:hypothetical protein